jgi:hypothetical protein
MRTTLTFGTILTTAFLILGCEKEQPGDLYITGKGEVVTVPIELAPFTDINLTGVADLNITVGGEQSVTLIAQQNIIDVMNWEVQLGTLNISMDENVTLKNHEPIRFDIVVNDLYNLLHDGVGDVDLQGEKRNAFEIDLRGVGDIGAYNLPVDQCSVFSSGVGDCYVHVIKTLEVDISGIGNVYYRGQPDINSMVTGVGNLIDDN